MFSSNFNGTLSSPKKSDIRAFSCTSGIASIHAINTDGSFNETALASVAIGGDGLFSFTDSQITSVSLSSDVRYILKASGCGINYFRPITGTSDQDVTGFSTLISMSSYVNDSQKRLLNSMTAQELESAIALAKSVSGTDLTNLINHVAANSTIRQKYLSLTGVDIAVLKNIPPQEPDVNAPSSVLENGNYSYSVTLNHWNTEYVAAYEWTLDGISVSTNSSWSYQTTKNSQGQKNITLKIGSANNAHFIDVSKPIKTINITTNVANTYPPEPPHITLVGNEKRNFRSSSVAMDTGVTQVNCETFSNLALTESAYIAPQDSDFTISCTSAGTQSVPILLSASEGMKTLALWAKDADGNVSETPTSVVIMLDQTDPSVTLGSLSSLKGGAPFDLTYTATDSLSGLASLKIYFAQNGTTFTEIADVFNHISPYSWSVPSINEMSSKIKIVATDLAGNSSEVTSNSFTIDSTAPSLTISSPSTNSASQTGITLVGACENGIVINFSGGISPSPQTGSCSSSTYSQSLTFSASDGTKNIVVTQTDAADNTTSVNRDFIKDTTAPLIAFTSPSANTQAQTGLIIAGTCESSLTVNISGAGVNSPSTTSCSSGTFTQAIVFSAGDGTKTITVGQTDSVGNSSSSSRNFERNNTAPAMTLTGPPDGTSSQTGLTLFGTCDNAYQIVVAGSGTTSGGSYTCSSGIFSIPITFTSGEGNKSITISQTDGVGNTSSFNRTYIKDTVAPTFTQTSLTSPYYSSTNTVTFSGACEDGLSLVTTGAESSSTACTSSSWSYATNKTSDGSYSYAFSQTDLAGNNTQVNATWVRDATPPTVTLTSLTGGQTLKGNQNHNITWAASDLTGLTTTPISLEYSLNAGASWTSIATGLSNSGSYTWSMPGFNSVNVRVRVKAVDLAGNQTTSTSSTNFTVDSSAPILTLTSLTGGQVIGGGQNYSLTWAASDNNFGSAPITIESSSNGGSSWSSVATNLANSGSYTWSVPSVSSSTYRVRVIATDLLNQSATAASNSNFTIDSTAPSVTLTSLTGGQYIPSNSNQNITWSASDANFSSNPITISISSNGGSTWTILADSLSNTGSYTWNANLSTGTTYRIRVTARDSVGNSTSSSSTSNFTISSGAPNLTQTAVVSPYVSSTATQITFGGACQTGLDITLTGNESATFSCPAGTWNFTTSTYSTDGTRDYTFSQTNMASETTTVTASWQRITAAPSITQVLINNNDSFTPTPTVSVTVTTSSNTGVKVRFANAFSSSASCQAQYANSGWLNQTNLTTTHTVILSSGDGEKKVCVWAKDSAGNVSVYSPVEGTIGTDVDTINYASGNPPRITNFEVINNAGGAYQGTQNAYLNDGLKITWTTTDVEGLANNPIYLDYTTNGTTWIPIESGYGGLSANPTSFTSDYYGFSAPSSSFFRLRFRVKDLAGNTSTEIYSKAFNVAPWAVVAGSLGRGEGGSAKSATVARNNSAVRNFALNPTNGDVYYLDADKAVMKVIAQTGLAQKFLSSGISLASTSSGILDPSKSISTSRDQILFDKKGFMYIVTGSTNIANTAKVFRVNPETLEYTTYLNGGNSFDSTSTPSNVFVAWGGIFAFDESNSLYFATSCTPGSWTFSNSTTSRLRLMKVTQNTNGTPGTVSIVAGDCVVGTPVSGQLATATPFAISHSNVNQARITVWDNGNAIYYSQYSSGYLHKIVSGTYYTTDIYGNNPIDIEYNAFDGLLYTSRDSVKAYQPNFSGSGGETEDTSKRILGTSTSAGCTDDGVLAANICGLYLGVYSSASGRVFFVEGGSTNNRFRYIDDSGSVQTLVGSQSFSGNNSPASIAKGLFSGIYYKKSSEPYSSAYPEGLYFIEAKGGVFGYFDTSWTTHNIWGNQSGSTSLGAGTVVSPSWSMGVNSGTGTGALQAMTFTELGLPWFKFNGHALGSLDQDRKYVIHNGTIISRNWFEAPTSADPRNYQLAQFGGMQNLSFSISNKLFLLGTYYASGSTISSSNDPNPKLRVFDYDNNNVIHLMGDVTAGVTNQQISEGSLQSKSISSACRNTGCSIQYLSDQDRLYFSEDATLRYITRPLDPTRHTLIDVFTASTVIDNFTISPNRKYIFYTKSGRLYCHAISSADNSAICKNSVAAHINLGPPTGLDSIDKGPNQMTWKDDSTLFISTYKGEIYQYTVNH